MNEGPASAAAGGGIGTHGGAAEAGDGASAGRWTALGVGGVVLAVLAGVLAAPARRVVGSPTVDGYGTQWFFWFAGEVLAGRQSAAWTDLLFHPWGKDVYAHTGGNLLDAFLAWPLRALLGPVAGFNLWAAVVLGTNAWAGARLSRALGVEGPLRAAGALALVVNPFVLGEIDLGRVTQAWLAPAGFALAGLISARRAREGLAPGLWLALTALGYWYYGLVLAGAAVGVGLVRLAVERGRVGIALANAVAACVAVVVALPFALPMLRSLGSGAVPGLLALDGDGLLAPLALRTVEGDAQGLYVVAPLAVAAGSLLDDGGLRFNPGVPALFPVHLLVAALGCAALVLRRDQAARGAGVWAPLLLVAALVVASGPAFVVGDTLVPNRPWIALVSESDVLRRWWWPGRAVFLAHLVLAPLAARLLSSLRRGAARAALGAALLVGAVAPLPGEGLAPLATWDASVPTSLACLAGAPAGGVVDVPLLVDQKNLWFQTRHHLPLLGGMLLKKAAFAPAAFTDFRRDDPLLRALDDVGERRYTRAVLPADAPARAALLAKGLRYVVARVDAFARPHAEADGRVAWISEWSRPRRQLLALLGVPAFEDEALAIWTVDGAPLDCAAARD